MTNSFTQGHWYTRKLDTPKVQLDLFEDPPVSVDSNLSYPPLVGLGKSGETLVLENNVPVWVRYEGDRAHQVLYGPPMSQG